MTSQAFTQPNLHQQWTDHHEREKQIIHYAIFKYFFFTVPDYYTIACANMTFDEGINKLKLDVCENMLNLKEGRKIPKVLSK